MKTTNLFSVLVLLTTQLFSQSIIDTDPSTAVDASFFKFIPTVDYGNILNQSGSTTFTTNYSPSGSYWLDPTAADEEHVYLAKLQHNAATEENSWQLRIGKGGQIYSLKSAYGEGIPPQSKEESTWNDEVWQPVSVSTNLNNREFTSGHYFIHGAGAYNHDGIEKTWYSPLMASYYDANEKSYSVTNWGAQAHIPSLYKSEVLYTTRYKEIGEGILEVTYVIQNYGDETLVHINAPWGGVRASSLPGKFVGLPNKGIEISEGNTGTAVGTDTRNIDETGGYVIWSESTSNSSDASMGVVFGNKIKTDELSDHNLRNIYLRLAQVGSDTNPRDYTLFTVIAQINIEKGETFYYRTYFIHGTRLSVQQKSNLLAPYSDYGFIEPTIDQSPKVTISKGDIDQGISKSISLHTTFAKDMVPMYLMKNTTTGENYISPDPYYNVVTANLVNPYPVGDAQYQTYQNRFVYKPYASNIEYVRLLGYAYTKNMSADNSYELLDNLILDSDKVVLTNNYTNKLWVQTIGGDNLALNGIALQSSTLHSGEANRAIDGNTNGKYSGGSVTHTENEENAYWQVTLDSEYSIGDINVYGRTDACCLERLSNFTVLVIDENLNRTFFEVVDGYPNPSVTVNANGATGKTIRIRSNTGAPLSLAEVEVFKHSTASSKEGLLSNKPIAIEEPKVILSPNPTATSFHINTRDIQYVNLYNVSGKLVKSFNGQQDNYDVEELTSGIYYVHITDLQGDSTVEKLIKN